MPESKQSEPRGAARRARTDKRLAVVVADQLSECTYAELTIEGVAAAAGVAKTTIYRRWASKAEMVFEVAVHRVEQAAPVNTGSLQGDVRVLAERAVTLVTGEVGRRILPGLLADMAGDADLAERLRESFVGAARADIDEVLDRGLARGELISAADVEGFHAALLGIPYARVHLLADEDVSDLAERLVDQLLRLLPLRRGEV